MGAEGFATFAWEGWLFGIIFLKKPWGPPQFTSYISFPPIWSLLSLSIQVFGMYLITTNIDTFIRPVINRNSLITYVNVAIVFNIGLANILTRIVFVLRAKDIAKVLNRLYYYKSPENCVLTSTRRLGWRCFYLTKILTTLSILILVGTSSALYAGPLAEASEVSKTVGAVADVVIGMFAFVLLQTPPVLGFFLVVTTVLHLCEEYEDFCNILKDEIRITSSCSVLTNKIKKRNPVINETFYLKRLDDLEGLFESADAFLSPLTLLTVSGSVALLIPLGFGVATLETNSDSETLLLKVSLGLQMIRQLTMLTIVVAGEHAKNMVLKTRRELQEVRLLQKHDDKSFFVGRKHDFDLMDVLKLAIDFDWRLSAYGFFDVSVQLLSGIMTTALSYIIILVQLRITNMSGG